MGKLGLGMLLFGACAFAADAFAASDDAAIQTTFVKPWIEALRSKDKARLERFVHPASLACVNPDTKEYFDNIVEGETASEVSGDYRISKITPLTGPPPDFLPPDQFPWPLRPTYEVRIDFDESHPDSHLEMVRFVAPANGSWFEVYPCPNKKGMEFFHAKLASGATQKRKTEQLLSELKDPLRTDLRDLLKRGKKIDAIKKYQAAASVDLTTAVMVINELQKADR